MKETIRFNNTKFTLQAHTVVSGQCGTGKTYLGRNLESFGTKTVEYIEPSICSNYDTSSVDALISSFDLNEEQLKNAQAVAYYMAHIKKDNPHPLSKGQAWLIIQMLKAMTTDKDILYIDEPESSLSLNYQSHYVRELFLAKKYNSNSSLVFYLATHAPFIYMSAKDKSFQKVEL